MKTTKGIRNYMMKFSDETVERAGKAYMNSGHDKGYYSEKALRAALSSLTLADLMGVDEVRELVDAGNKVMSNYLFVMSAQGAGETIRDDFLNLHDKLTPFTEAK